MASANVEKLGTYLEDWVKSVPGTDEVTDEVRDAQDALIEAGMVQFKEDGWDFKLHEKNPDAPKAQFKLMIRQAPGVDTNPDYYDRFTLPAVLEADNHGALARVKYVLGYPNAGTDIAAAFIRMADTHLGIKPAQLLQEKVTHDDGSRELGDILGNYEKDGLTWAVDDAATGGDTKIEGWRKVIEHDLAYAGLSLIVERDPLGSALVRERTGADVLASIHWLSIVQRAAEIRDLPRNAVQREMDYTLRLFDWNVTHDKLGSLPMLSEVE